MFPLRPKTAFTVLGLFVCLALLDGAFRFGFLPVMAPVCNSGIGLGITLPESVLWVVVILMLGLALQQSLVEPWGVENIAWGAVLIGGTVNAIDRWAHGCVMDYIKLSFFPSFNLADIMIFLGVAILLSMLPGILPKAKPYVS
jgi:lipoprotein signal peptidase